MKPHAIRHTHRPLPDTPRDPHWRWWWWWWCEMEEKTRPHSYHTAHEWQRLWERLIGGLSNWFIIDDTLKPMCVFLCWSLVLYPFLEVRMHEGWMLETLWKFQVPPLGGGVEPPAPCKEEPPHPSKLKKPAMYVFHWLSKLGIIENLISSLSCFFSWHFWYVQIVWRK